MDKFEPIQKPFYDALAEGKFLGRKCSVCGNVEFPAYPLCNKCGNRADEWYDLTDAEVTVHEVYSIKPAFTIDDYQPYAPVFGCECSMAEGPEFTCLLFGVTPRNYKEKRDSVPLTGKLVAVPMDGYSTFAVAIDGAVPVRKENGAGTFGSANMHDRADAKVKKDE